MGSRGAGSGGDPARAAGGLRRQQGAPKSAGGGGGGEGRRGWRPEAKRQDSSPRGESGAASPVSCETSAHRCIQKNETVKIKRRTFLK